MEKEPPPTLDRPRSMRDPAERARRREMLALPHIAPLAAYAESLRNHGEVPDFDPLDGGIHARVLFLLEKPGPMTAEKGGSGFISRNNDDPTAEATFNFLKEARIPREITVLWNVVPWWNGTRNVTAEELRDGVACIRDLVGLLPDLRVVVLVGAKAARARPLLENAGYPILTSAHPSPVTRAAYREQWDAIPTEWARVHEYL